MQTLIQTAPPAGETRHIARHAGTVLVGQIAVMAFGIADTIVAGRFAEGALAALSVGTAIYVSVSISLMGVLQALLPVWAELYGARRYAEVGRAARQSLYLYAVISAIGIAMLLLPDPLMRWTGVPDAMRAEVQAYLRVQAFALPAALLFRLFSTLNQSLGKPKLVTVLQLAALGPKVLLSIWFTFGGAGLPASGLVGCGWATLAVNWSMAIAALWMLRSQSFYRDYHIWQRIEGPDWRQIGHFARLGVPGGLTVLVEITSFTLMALFIARLGNAAAGAHQIMANLIGLAYMTPLSLGIATSARVSYWLGTRDGARARRACRQGFLLAVGLALLYGLLMAALHKVLPAIYTDNAAVEATASSLLLVAAGFHLADATQTLCVFVLRCFRVTILPLVVYCTLLWGLGLGGGYLLAYRGLGPWAAMQSPLAFWLMGGTALVLTASIFLLLLVFTLRRIPSAVPDNGCRA